MNDNKENDKERSSGADSPLLLLRLGQGIFNYHKIKNLSESGELPTPPADPAKLFESIKKRSRLIQALTAISPLYDPLQKAFGLRGAGIPSEPFIQVLALIAHHDFAGRGGAEITNDTVGHQIAPVLSPDDYLAGVMEGRRVVGELLEKGILVLREQTIHASKRIHLWLTGGELLALPMLEESHVRQHLINKNSKREPTRPLPLPIASPADLYNRLREYVVGQDEACRVLATRGWLHLKRAELLKSGQCVGANECLFFISQQSGVGKTWLTENYGRICSLPFTSFSATDATAVGYVGLDLVEDALKALLRTANTMGNQLSPDDPSNEYPNTRKIPQGAIVFYDEFTKQRRTGRTDGRFDAGVQQEILRVMEGCAVQIGNRRTDREVWPTEVDTTGMMFVFGGFVEGFEKLIAKRKNQGIGFSGLGANEGPSPTRDSYLYDAMVDYGFIPEFVNRLTKIVMFRKLTAEDLGNIASGPSGVIATYTRFLFHQGLTITFTPEAIQSMAEICVETGMMARGLRLIVGGLVEDAVFNQAKGFVEFGSREVEAAIRGISLTKEDEHQEYIQPSRGGERAASLIPGLSQNESARND